MFRPASAVVLATLVAGTAFAQAEQRSVKGSAVAIYNLVGRLRIVAGSGDAVGVEITRVGPDASRLKIETGAIRGRETLRIVYPLGTIIYPEMRGWSSRTSLDVREDGTFSDGTGSFRDRADWRSGDRVTIRSSGTGFEGYADLLVRVPKGQKVEFYLAVGRVEATNVDGDVLIDVGSADVEVTGGSGVLSLDTGSGRTTVRDLNGDLHIDSGSGSVSVVGIKGSILSLDTGSGSIDASNIAVTEFTADVGSGGLNVYKLNAPRVTIETGSGGAQVELIGEVERVQVESGSGGVTVRAPATLSAEIDAETGSGGFHTDFEIVTSRLGRNHVVGRIGAGKGRMRLESGSGTIRILKG